MEFAYDTSRLKRTGGSGVGGVRRAGRTAGRASCGGADIASVQKGPADALPSARCIFQNPDPAVDRVPEGRRRRPALWSPRRLQGYRVGGAAISSPGNSS